MLVTFKGHSNIASEIMLWLSTNFEPPKRRKPKPSGTALKLSDDDGEEDIVVNTDGTMEARIE